MVDVAGESNRIDQALAKERQQRRDEEANRQTEQTDEKEKKDEQPDSSRR